MIKASIIPAFLILLFHTTVTAQNDQWVTFTNANSISCLEVDNNYLWAGTSGGAVRWDLNTGEYVKFTTDDGLSSNHICDIAVDSDGNIWCATLKGLNVFDGASWTFYKNDNASQKGNHFTSIAIDSEGNKWLGSWDGVHVFTGSDWISYSTSDGLISKVIYSVAIDSNGIIWFGPLLPEASSEFVIGVSSFNDGIWTNFDFSCDTTQTIGGVVTDIIIDRNNVKWFCTDYGLNSYNDTSWTQYHEKDGLVSNVAISIAVDHDNSIWIGTNEGVCRFDGSTWETFTSDDGLIDNNVRAIAVDAAENKWFGTRFGISKFDGSSWTSFITENEVPYNFISSVAVDQDGKIWAGTNGRGVGVFDGTDWTTYISTDGLIHNRIFSIAIDRNNVKWFGTPVGACCYDGSIWKSYTEEDGLVNNTVNAIVVDSDNSKWFGTSGGACYYDGSIWKSYSEEDGLAHNTVNAIVVDSDNSKWFGTRGGASHFDHTTWNSYYTTDGLAYNCIMTAAIGPDGAIWFGTLRGVSRFDGSVWKNFSTADGLTYDRINALAIDNDGTVWVGALFGLNVIRNDSVSTIALWDDSLGPNELEYPPGIYSIAIDPYNGTKWIGTLSNGLLAFGKSADIVSEKGAIVSEYALFQNYPNPFNPRTTIGFRLPEDAYVELAVYNILGQKVARLIDGYRDAGYNTASWNANRVASGVYIYQLKTSGATTDKIIISKRMMVIR